MNWLERSVIRQQGKTLGPPRKLRPGTQVEAIRADAGGEVPASGGSPATSSALPARF